ncbi:MAG: exodeoxyribonuclease V subunit alpha [[Actinobacillus] rossii]|nr:exodeoxyribonuclease V subunit alpha [[Actinobacillus] rossii]MDY5792710.1 exodeoxyribonuclease V subunit alpha [[Actinobacillus] rossii]
MLNILSKLRHLNVISAADYYFAKFIHDKQQNQYYSELEQDVVLLVAAVCHQSYLQGNTCIRLTEDLLRNPFALAERYSHETQLILSEIQIKFTSLKIEQGKNMLCEHIAFTTTPESNEAPFVIQGETIYLYRAWQDEQTVVNYLKSAVKKSQFAVPMDSTREILARYFAPRQGINWQKIAVATALIQPFTLISGGPGTGKTYTVARLLAVIQELQLQQNLPLLRIRLAAPTGKAAARLKESINNSLSQMALPKELEGRIATDSTTIHRLLGVRPFEDAVRFNEQNPLPLDLLIIDEASMIDLSMMAKLLRALPEQARLILLGDKDQLASVEAGAILAELGEFLKEDYSAEFANTLKLMTDETVPISMHASAIRQSFALLTESTRFDDTSPVGRVAKAINEMQAEQSWSILSTEIPLVEYESQHQLNETDYRQQYIQRILQSAVENYAKYLTEIPNTIPTNEQLEKVFAAFNSVRYLTALRAGDFGVENLNEKIAQALCAKGKVQFKHSRDWFVGKPIMITQNDVNVGLLNGDIGLYLGNRVYFESEQGYKSLSINRIPAHELAFAMTIHKSQGSEFGLTVVILPPEPSPILTKELLYTAVTRAKPNLMVYGRKSIWESAVRNPVKRLSGIFNSLSD